MKKILLVPAAILYFLFIALAMVAAEPNYGNGTYGNGLYGVAADAGPAISSNSPNFTSNLAPEISAVILDPYTAVQTNASSPIIININGTKYNSSDNCSGSCSYNASTGVFLFVQPSNLSEGVYLVNITASDKGQPVSTRSFSWNMTVDKTAPAISFSLSDTSVYVGEIITGTCTATDNLDSNPITAITGIDTTTAGTKTAACTATDATGNANQNTLSYTVNQRPSGGVISGPISQSSSFSEMAQGSHSIDFTNIGIAIRNIEIETTGKATNVRLTVTQLDEKPSSVLSPQSEKVFGYLQIGHANLDNSLIGSAKIKFKVPKAWITSNGVQASKIALYRFTSGWDMLGTTMISQDSTYYYFEANSPGLSYFAIGTAEVGTTIPTAPATPATPPVPTIPPATDQENTGITPAGGSQITGQAIGQSGYRPWVISLVLLVVIGLIIGGYFYFKKRRNSLKGVFNRAN